MEHQFGLVYELPVAGQRVVTDPGIVNGAFITTVNTPPSTPCGLASSMLLDINYKNGGNGGGSSPKLDINGDKTINASNQYNGTNPVGIALKAGYASAPVTIGPNQNGNLSQLITISSGQQMSVINPNNTSRQSAWWQIQ